MRELTLLYSWHKFLIIIYKQLIGNISLTVSEGHFFHMKSLDQIFHMAVISEY